MRLTSPRSGLLTAALLALFETAKGHSWPESTRRIATNGTFIGEEGFDRAHIDRENPREQFDYLLPPNGLSTGKLIMYDHPIVRKSQGPLGSSSYSEKFPMLKVAPGDFVSIFYLENGHVTRADGANPNKPINRGTIYLYGTYENDLSKTTLTDVLHTWTADGKGGNGKGRLLATRNYDDGQCHEPIPATGDPEGISRYRKDEITQSEALRCQSDLQIPLDAKPGDVLTVLWIWDWPDMNKPGAAVPPASFHANSSDFGEYFVTVPEIYTGVVDYKIVDPCDDSLGAVKGPTCSKGGKSSSPFSGILNSKKRFRNRVKFDSKQPAEFRGIQRQMVQPFMVKVPQAGFGGSNRSSAKFFPGTREGRVSVDKANIPLAGLIGKETKPPVPFSMEILDGQRRYLEEEAVPEDDDDEEEEEEEEENDGPAPPTSIVAPTQTQTTPASSPTVPTPTDGADSSSIAPKPTEGTETIAPSPSSSLEASTTSPKPTDGAGSNPGREDGVFYVTVTVPTSFVTVTVPKTATASTATATATASQEV
ncbi:hypothetical protein QC763_104400 [Podospora pseudopauciseta]|uniref:DUF7492 domain-containing protein n=1 Tax=Podospora pseudopauciseta TaxID=2093780 RepID=A0ABR0HXH7_9PEZI|nr:hypothetical protein QC763_104400 [Podospora pseudopauciseta]